MSIRCKHHPQVPVRNVALKVLISDEAQNVSLADLDCKLKLCLLELALLSFALTDSGKLLIALFLVFCSRILVQPLTLV